jgi:WD40 repeat protein
VDLHLSPREHEFVTASLAARERDRAEAERLAAHQHRLERRSLRRLQALLFLVALVALAAAVLWWTNRTATRIAQARQLAVASDRALADDPQLALLLALEGRDRLGAIDDEARDDVAAALHAAIAGNRLVGLQDDVGSLLGTSPDGTVLVTTDETSATTDGPHTVIARDARTGAVLARLQGHDRRPTWADATDVGHVAVGTEDGVVRVWDWRSGRLLDRLDHPVENADVTHLELSPDGRHVALTGAFGPGGPVMVWDRTTGQQVAEYEASKGRAVEPRAHFNPDSTSMLLVLPADDEVQVRAGRDWEEVRDRMEHAGLFDAAWSPDGRWLAIAGDQLVVLDAVTHTAVVTANDVPRISDGKVVWSRDSTLVGIGSSDEQQARTRVWTVVEDAVPVDRLAPPLVLQDSPLSCQSVFAGPDPDAIIEGSRCGDGLRIWGLGPDVVSEVAHLPGDDVQAAGLAFSRDGTMLASGGADGALQLWSTRTWDRLLVVEAHPDDWRIVDRGLLDVAWDPDDQLVATAGSDDAALWSADDGAGVRLPGTGPGAIDVAPDGQVVAYSGLGRSLEEAEEGADGLVWMADRSGNAVATLAWPDVPVVSGPIPVPYVADVAFSPDGRLVAATLGSFDFQRDPVDRVVVWDVREEQVSALLPAGRTAGLGRVERRRHASGRRHGRAREQRRALDRAGGRRGGGCGRGRRPVRRHGRTPGLGPAGALLAGRRPHRELFRRRHGSAVGHR